MKLVLCYRHNKLSYHLSFFFILYKYMFDLKKSPVFSKTGHRITQCTDDVILNLSDEKTINFTKIYIFLTVFWL